ncbi:type VI secretion system baseplate subunit TssE [Bryobacter aggregatus]|uniref:type VI secretion system baseplate subunit TssE n=1 Tax=Bryobacter aggregatus TaxID=360054 RepID=UPI0004E2869D|nr:type VI secretion system baseplate subunit TssE [Bryobacter aggregatus]
MAFQLDVLVTLSVVDRLIDQEPRNTSEASPTRAESVRRLRAAVRRDLEWLLNSRRIAVPPDPSLLELNKSAYNYGLPDVSSISLSSVIEQERLLSAIEKAVQLFEPRLTDVRVIPMRDDSKKSIQRLDFRIEALLLMDPAPEHITFDTTLDAVSQSYKVKTDGAE